MNNIYIMTIDQRKEIETSEQEFKRPENVNQMCKDCIMNCPGTTNKIWTGCVYKHTKNFLKTVKMLKQRGDWDQFKRCSMSDYEIEYLQKKFNVIF